ncbi:hypothetical protein [Pandoraea communis]|uniref:Uncharacterized protein n=1 Tax=Pandoraea communis TaxID=2508297 RepID=A0A5E4RZ29_9BURK|nr:hypothetical protein [Pandoraea communis]MDM8359086.1 hypothetical protein [Pandoraea communis]VVD68716.1 hypothetical protein PCO31111_00502 [Pandoraea communis]
MSQITTSLPLDSISAALLTPTALELLDGESITFSWHDDMSDALQQGARDIQPMQEALRRHSRFGSSEPLQMGSACCCCTPACCCTAVAVVKAAA